MKTKIITLLTAMIVLASVQYGVSAVNMEIVYSGQTRATTQFNADNVMNWDVNIGRDATDFTWSRVNAHVSVISGDSARPIGKLYLYRCKNYNPIDCLTKVDVPEPLEFGSYADADLSWNDISASDGSLRYPQTANILLLAKLEGENEAWTGLFVKIKRLDYNQFNVPFNYELGSVKVFPSSESLVQPVKDYIDNFHMIPMRWVDRVTFTGSSALYSLGANSEEMETQPVNFRPERPVNEIRQITKDFYFVFPETIEGVANPITLNLNPTSECGDGTCQASLGESGATCCYDCGCPTGQFCDVNDPTVSNAGACTQSNMALQISGLFREPIKNCESGGVSHFTAAITNAPSGLVSNELSGTLEIEDFLLPVDCSGTPGAMDCSFDFSTDILCGDMERNLEYTFTLPIEYYNGQNTITNDLRVSNSGNPIKVKYQCGCDEGMFCDLRENTCQDEESMMINLLEYNTPKYNINTGGLITMLVQVDYAPLNHTLTSTRYNIREILQDEDILPGFSGLMNCSLDRDYGEPDVYECTIRYQIPGYDRELEYILNKNKITFNINYNDVGKAKTRVLTTDIPEVLIPPSECNDGRCDKEKGESEKTCCLDCGCGKDTSLYCDEKRGCQSTSVSLSVQSAKPTSFDDCAEDHTMTIKATIGKGAKTESTTADGLTGMGINVEPASGFGVPTGIALSGYELLEDGGASEYASLTCDEVNEATGSIRCQVEISPIEECKTTKTIGPFQLQVMASWPNGLEDIVEKTLTAELPSISIKPVSHPGDGTCEENYGESAANSCLDCPCEDDAQFGSDFYCDVGNSKGTCKSKSNVNLAIDNPKQDVKISSCSSDEDVEIRARIANAPAGTNMQYATATLDGKDATVSCTPVYGGAGGGMVTTGGSLTGWSIKSDVTGMGIAVEPTSGITPPGGMVGTGAGVPFNCVLVVPAEEDCQESKTYKHTATLSIYISYKNGKNVEIGMVSAALPQIIVNPGEGGGEDDDEGGITDLEKTLEEKNKVMKELEETYKSCDGWWDEKAKYSGKWLLYKTAQAATEWLATSLCTAAQSVPVIGQIACIALKGTDALLPTGSSDTATDAANVAVPDTSAGATGSIIKKNVEGLVTAADAVSDTVTDVATQAVTDTATQAVTDTVNDAATTSEEGILEKILNSDITKTWLNEIDEGDEEMLGFDVSDYTDPSKWTASMAIDYVNKDLGVIAHGLTGIAKEAIAAGGEEWINTQKQKCEEIKTQMLAIAADIKIEGLYLVEVKCTAEYQTKLENGECDEIKARACALALQKCEANVAKIVREAEKLLQQNMQDLQRQQNEINSAMQAAYEQGYSVFVPGGGSLYLDFNNDNKPDRFYCGSRTYGDVRVIASCDSGEQPVVKKIAGGQELPLTTFTFKATDIFSYEGPFYFRLYCGGERVGDDMSVCYCKGQEGQKCDAAENCQMCASYILTQEDITAPQDATNRQLCEAGGYVWNEVTAKCEDCNIDTNNCPSGTFCGYNLEDKLRCLNTIEIERLCGGDCRRQHGDAKPYCNYKSKNPECVECVTDDHCTSITGGKSKCETSTEGNMCTELPDLFIPDDCIWVCVTNDGYFNMLGMWVANGGSSNMRETARITVKVYAANGDVHNYAVDRIENLNVNKKTWRYQDMKSAARAEKIEVVLNSDRKVDEVDESNNNVILKYVGNNIVTMEVGGREIRLQSSQIKSDCANINVRDMANTCSSWGTQGYGT